jgi:hypothetical protein
VAHLARKERVREAAQGVILAQDAAPEVLAQPAKDGKTPDIS